MAARGAYCGFIAGSNLPFWLSIWCYVLYLLCGSSHYELSSTDQHFPVTSTTSIRSWTVPKVGYVYQIAILDMAYTSQNYFLQKYARKRFVKRRISYTTKSSASFNPAIVILTRSGVNIVNPGPEQQPSHLAEQQPSHIHRLPKHENWMAHFSCRSIMTHMDELRLTFLDIYPLLIGITETWLDNSIADSEIEIPGFSVQRLDRKSSRRGGGVAVYLAGDVKYGRRNDLEEDDFEALWIQVRLQNINYLIGCVYRAPSDSLRCLIILTMCCDTQQRINWKLS